MREGLRVERLAHVGEEQDLAGGLSESEIYGNCFAAVRYVDEVNPGVTLDDVRRRVGGAVGDHDDLHHLARVVEASSESSLAATNAAPLYTAMITDTVAR